MPGYSQYTIIPWVTAFPYWGGKNRVLHKLYPLFPDCETFMDLFTGSGVVLLNYPGSGTKIMNDKNPDIARFFQVMASDKGDEFVRRLLEIPYSNKVFNDARRAANSGFRRIESEIEKAAATFTLLTQSFNACMRHWVESSDKGRGYASNNAFQLQRLRERMRGVIVENRDAVDILRESAGDANTMMFLDPPYIHNLRKSPAAYEYEMTIRDHERLLHTVKDSKNCIMICGYHSHDSGDLYDFILLPAGWRHYKLCDLPKSGATSAKKPIGEEFIWVNYELPKGAGNIIDLDSANWFR